jgi:hypothetical protein
MIDQDLANVVRANEEDGFWTAQIEAFGQPESGLVPIEVAQPHGLLSVPLDATMAQVSPTRREADPQKSARLWYGWQNDAAVGLLLHDMESVRALPLVKKGGTVLYGGPKAALSYLRLDGDGSVKLSSGASGAAMTMVMASGATEFAHPAGATMALRASGAEVYGPQVRLGGAGGAPLALAPTLTTILQAILTALTTIAAKTVPTTAPDVAPIVTQVTALLAQLGTVQTVAK